LGARQKTGRIFGNRGNYLQISAVPQHLKSMPKRLNTFQSGKRAELEQAQAWWLAPGRSAAVIPFDISDNTGFISASGIIFDRLSYTTEAYESIISCCRQRWQTDLKNARSIEGRERTKSHPTTPRLS
jgi:hypothetical protein